MCAAAAAERGDERSARGLERHALDLMPEGWPVAREPAALRLALAVGDGERVRRHLHEDPGADSWDVDYGAARLDALAAIGDAERVEEEAQRALELGGYVEPFALRALGRVRSDEVATASGRALFSARPLPTREAGAGPRLGDGGLRPTAPVPAHGMATPEAKNTNTDRSSRRPRRSRSGSPPQAAGGTGGGCRRRCRRRPRLPGPERASVGRDCADPDGAKRASAGRDCAGPGEPAQAFAGRDCAGPGRRPGGGGGDRAGGQRGQRDAGRAGHDGLPSRCEITRCDLVRQGCARGVNRRGERR